MKVTRIQDLSVKDISMPVQWLPLEDSEVERVDHMEYTHSTFSTLVVDKMPTSASALCVTASTALA